MELSGELKTMLGNFPSGLCVYHLEKEQLCPVFCNEAFYDIMGYSDVHRQQYCAGAVFIGIHEEDLSVLREKMKMLYRGEDRFSHSCRIFNDRYEEYRWIHADGSLVRKKDGTALLYMVFQDISSHEQCADFSGPKKKEERELLWQRYRESILQHYRSPEPNVLLLGHCNLTKGNICEMVNYTCADLSSWSGSDVDSFLHSISELIEDRAQRKFFCKTFRREAVLEAFERGEKQKTLECFVCIPEEDRGKYVRFWMNMVVEPDSGDVTGILKADDVTESTIADYILHQISVMEYDFVVDLDLTKDRYRILACSYEANAVPPMQGLHSEWVQRMMKFSIVPKDRETYRIGLDPESIRERLRTEKSYTFSYSIYDGKGDILTKSMKVTAIDLRIGRVCLVRSDITNPVREQQSLLNMMAYTFERMAYINISDRHMRMYTRESVLQNRKPYVSDNYEESIEQIVQAYVPEESEKEDRASVRKQFLLETMLKKLFEKPEGYDFVLAYPEEDRIHYKQINVMWGDENHRTICMVRADVTDILTAERRSKRALEDALLLARKANLAKSDFLSSMSHDIRTPMNAIMGMTSLAIAYHDDPVRVMDCLQKIQVSSRHLLSLINDILDMSKIEQSCVGLNEEPVSVLELVEQVKDMIGPQAEEAGIGFTVCKEQISHEFFLGDELRLKQILINILGNSVKFTPEGGEIELLVRELPLQGTEGAVRFCFSVSDTGIGMPHEMVSRIFEPFVRSNTSVEGTGLGLSITKGLVDLMGGKIYVKSSVGKGTVFSVEFVFKEASAPAESLPLPEGSRVQAFAGRCFLVAEDNAINAEILSELLKLEGARSVIKTDGRKAVRAFQESEPGTYDAVLMDIQMPEMNGYEAVRAIRSMARADAKTIPVLAMTANAFAEDVQSALEAGMNGHVAKPINIKVLRETLQKVLE